MPHDGGGTCTRLYARCHCLARCLIPPSFAAVIRGLHNDWQSKYNDMKAHLQAASKGKPPPVVDCKAKGCCTIGRKVPHHPLCPQLPETKKAALKVNRAHALIAQLQGRSSEHTSSKGGGGGSSGSGGGSATGLPPTLVANTGLAPLLQPHLTYAQGARCGCVHVIARCVPA